VHVVDLCFVIESYFSAVTACNKSPTV